jgi:acyl-CoA synthetase (AMP-forming)/AMP-acid ligase II
MSNKPVSLCSVLAAIAAVAATPVAAEPATHPQASAASSRDAQPPIVLASADNVRAATPKPQQSDAAQKPVAPRVTTCRCGDADPGDAASDEQ